MTRLGCSLPHSRPRHMPSAVAAKPPAAVPASRRTDCRRYTSADTDEHGRVGLGGGGLGPYVLRLKSQAEHQRPAAHTARTTCREERMTRLGCSLPHSRPRHMPSAVAAKPPAVPASRRTDCRRCTSADTDEHGRVGLGGGGVGPYVLMCVHHMQAVASVRMCCGSSRKRSTSGLLHVLRAPHAGRRG